jgi:ribose transport system permease protein
VSDVVANESGDASQWGRFRTAVAAAAARPGSLFDRFYELPLILVFVVSVGVIGSFHSQYLTRYSLINLGTGAAYYGTMAFGMVFLLSMREIDLSVGSIFGLTIILEAHLMTNGVNPWVAALAGLGLGPCLGAVNGVLANALKIQTIIVTLGTLSIYRSLALIMSHDTIVEGHLPTQSSYFVKLGGSYFTIPVSIWMFGILAVVLHVIYRYTRFGFNVRTIGSNPEAARLAGISIPRVRLTALVMQGTLCSICGIVAFAYFIAGDPITGTGYELSIIAAAIIGGTALSGGQGSVIGAGIGALIISVITTGLIQFGVTQDWAVFATGSAIIAAVALDAFLKRRRLRAAERVGLSRVTSRRRRRAADVATIAQGGTAEGEQP